MIRRIAVLLGCVGVTVLAALPAVAADPSFPGPDQGQPGIPGFFIAMFILVPVIGIATTIWRVSTARRIAQNAGMDPDDATSVALLNSPGLDATYVAASLRNSASDTGHVVADLSRSARTPASPAPRSTEDRLRELTRLRDESLITDEEYNRRRETILNSV